MKNQFADYETSRKLKELGFNDECLFAYDGRMPKALLNFNTIKNSELKLSDEDISDNYATTPMWLQVEEWLWEKHGFQFQVYFDSGKFVCLIEYFPLLQTKLKVENENPIISKIEGIRKAVEYLCEHYKNQ